MVCLMNWIAVSDRLPSQNEHILAVDNFQEHFSGAVYVDGTWYEADYEGDVIRERVRCSMGCCYDYEDKELDFWPTHWALPDFPE